MVPVHVLFSEEPGSPVFTRCGDLSSGTTRSSSFTAANRKRSPASVRHIHGDVSDVATRADELRALKPDVVVDMLAFRRQDAARIELFHGVAARGVVISSADVYRAFGRIWRTEPGPPDPTPLTEDSPIREQLSVDGLAYDKTGVEQELRDSELPVTVLRYPAVHGPHDPAHRTFGYVKRMVDNRPAILLDETVAGWRWVRGYVENVGHATALAVSDDCAAGRIYNVAGPVSYTEAEWVSRLAAAHGWDGDVIAAPASILPPRMRVDNDTTQITPSTRVAYGQNSATASL